MPPKTRQAAAQNNVKSQQPKKQQDDQDDQQAGDRDNKGQADEATSPEPGEKRKADDIAEEPVEDSNAGEDTIEPDAKKQKKITASSSASNSKQETVKWLLSKSAFDLAFPTLPEGHGEIDWDPASRRKVPPAEDAGKADADAEDNNGNKPLLTYPDSSLTPFQNLVAALILSKPLSHRLGMRTINTLLNSPFGLRTAADLDEAGFEGRRKVMWEARTQHKEKTASQLGDLVEGVREINGSVEGLEDLAGLRKQLADIKVEEAQQKVKSVLEKGIKGVGPMGVSIFLRRVQGDWEEVFPFADERSLEAASEFGLVSGNDGAEELAELIEGDREKFVRLLDILVGIQLEKKMDEALKMVKHA